MALCGCLCLIFQPSRAPEFKGSKKDVLWISDSPVTLPNLTSKKLFSFYCGGGAYSQKTILWSLVLFLHLYMGFRDQTQTPHVQSKSLSQPSCLAIPSSSRDGMLSVNRLHNPFLISQPYLWCHVLKKLNPRVIIKEVGFRRQVKLSVRVPPLHPGQVFGLLKLATFPSHVKPCRHSDEVHYGKEKSWL